MCFSPLFNAIWWNFAIELAEVAGGEIIPFDLRATWWEEGRLQYAPKRPFPCISFLVLSAIAWLCSHLTLSDTSLISTREHEGFLSSDSPLSNYSPKAPIQQKPPKSFVNQTSAVFIRSVDQLIHQRQVIYCLPGVTHGINGTLSDCATHWVWWFFILLRCSCWLTSVAPQTEAILPNAAISSYAVC